MKRGGLRWDEQSFAAFHGRSVRWAAGTINGQKADAATDGATACDCAPLPVRTPIRADAASTPTYPLVALCRSAGLPEPIPEYRFHHARKWRADYCWPIHRIIVEIDGGLFVQGRHSRGAGMLKDFEKLNAAALLGYAVLRYAPSQLKRECLRDLRLMFAR